MTGGHSEDTHTRYVRAPTLVLVYITQLKTLCVLFLSRDLYPPDKDADLCPAG